MAVSELIRLFQVFASDAGFIDLFGLLAKVAERAKRW